jgi:hypothetical protein
MIEVNSMENGNQPATKQDVQTAVQEAKDELLEAMRGIETKLLQAFYGYAKSNDGRVLEVEANEAVLRTRVATLESRVMEVERRLNIPPAQ